MAAGVGAWFSARDEARRVELEADEEVESSGISTTFHVCSVASGAKETRRFALRRQVLANGMISEEDADLPIDFRRASLFSRII